MLEIIQPGFKTTLQDLGRKGYRHLGVAQSGALNPPLLSMANLLVGNPANTAAIEITAGTLHIAVHNRCQIAVCGNYLRVKHNGVDKTATLLNQRAQCEDGDEILVETTNSGIYNYLCVAGGIKASKVFNSRSTDAHSNIGGLDGRYLTRGDQLEINSREEQNPYAKPVGTMGIRPNTPSKFLRAIPGPEYNQFSNRIQQAFWHSDWHISADSDRMGCRLVGPSLIDSESNPSSLPASHAVLPGTVQLPHSGKPIVLLADAQTTGGYPKIASVISADLWQLSCLPTGSAVQFIPCTRQQAIAALRQHRAANYRFTLALKLQSCYYTEN